MVEPEKNPGTFARSRFLFANPDQPGEVPAMSTVYVLVAINLAFYALMVATTRFAEAPGFSPGTLLRFGALYTPVIQRGQLWRLFNAIFLHVTPQHLVTNMIALICAGSIALPLYGRERLMLIYLVAGVGGSVASVLWRWRSSASDDDADRDGEPYQRSLLQTLTFHWRRTAVSVGASGAICGLIGAGAARGYLLGGAHGEELSAAMLQWGALMLAYGLFATADNAAHLGGLITGAAAGWLLAPRGHERITQFDGSFGIESVAVMVLALVALLMAFTSRDSSTCVPDLIATADELANAGRDGEAIDRYRRALWLQPRNAEAHYRLALVWLRDGDHVSALQAATAATEFDPESETAHALVDRILVAIGNR
jgi:membrane associated rhomboid family serine protease